MEKNKAIQKTYKIKKDAEVNSLKTWLTEKNDEIEELRT